MIALGVDAPGWWPARTRHVEVVPLHLRLDTDSAEVFCHEAEAIALLDPEFADLTKDRGATGAGGECGEEGNLVDEPGDLRRQHLGGLKLPRRHLQLAQGFTKLVL